jgi:hypothetical protein
MSLFTFAGLEANRDVSVHDAVVATNRALEKPYPDCTIQVVETGDCGTPAEWVTVELEVTPESHACTDWYVSELARSKIVLQDKVKRSSEVPVDFIAASERLVAAAPA